MNDFYYHPVRGEVLEDPGLPEASQEAIEQTVRLYQGALSITEEEAQTLVLIQSVPPQDRTLDQWMTLERYLQVALQKADELRLTTPQGAEE